MTGSGLCRSIFYRDPAYKVSWGETFAGVVLALAIQFLLNLLGGGIGAAVSTLQPTTIRM